MVKNPPVNPGTQVQPLVGELGSHMPWGQNAEEKAVFLRRQRLEGRGHKLKDAGNQQRPGRSNERTLPRAPRRTGLANTLSFFSFL